MSHMSLLERLGFVKLARYGLVKTADNRIASLHDGRVVGWTDEDGPPQELPARTFAMAPPPLPPQVAPLVVDEPADDEWEWVIAIARARAEATDAAFTDVETELDEADFTDGLGFVTYAPPAAPPQRVTAQQQAVHPRGMSPQTLLPIPKLPRADSDSARHLSPVISPRRFPAGTGRHPRG
jgi:hypothetical protein